MPAPEAMTPAATVAEPAPAPPPTPAAARLQQTAASAFAAPDPHALNVRTVRTRQPVAAWVASLLALVLLAGAAIAFRTPIMHAWPPSTRLYDAMGLHRT